MPVPAVHLNASVHCGPAEFLERMCGPSFDIRGYCHTEPTLEVRVCAYVVHTKYVHTKYVHTKYVRI